MITFNLFIDIKISHNENILVDFFKNHFRVVKIQEVASLVTIYMQNGWNDIIHDRYLRSCAN